MKTATIHRYIQAATPAQVATALDRASVGTSLEEKAREYRQMLAGTTDPSELEYFSDCALDWLETAIIASHPPRHFLGWGYEIDEHVAIALRDAGTVI